MVNRELASAFGDLVDGGLFEISDELCRSIQIIFQHRIGVI
ncbi:hypothetical protein VCHE09_3181 [Vibrio paracholerae HE-09]|nr:hypothetical protein VCHE09_3181 [Vibrio paracholerae HE-09]